MYSLISCFISFLILLHNQLSFYPFIIRWFMLMTHNAILRGESLFLADLSDLCMINHKEDISNEVEILILRIATGKTNNLKTLFGRCMRHIKVEMHYDQDYLGNWNSNIQRKEDSDM